MSRIFVVVVSCFIWVACGEDANGPNKQSEAEQKVSFTRISPEDSGIKFRNTIVESVQANYMIYDGIYQGSGVGIGDFNKDGLQDIFLAGNMVADKLYYNKGDFQFEDVTVKAGIREHRGWSTGVTVADFNNDGWQDIYVSQALWEDSNLRANKLYVNKGDGTFDERAEEMGLADRGYTYHAIPFDFDHDGDLDLFTVNQPPNITSRRGSFKNKRVYAFSGRLYKNTNGVFTDNTEESGVVNFGFALAAVPTDLNNDGLTDFYITYDYDEPDLMYINQGNGTFVNVANEQLAHISNFSMGVDVADINNDGLMDIFTADMVAPGHERIKTQMSGMNPERFFALRNAGYHSQYMFNSLQVNNGNGRFSEISQLAGVGNTDWSWASLFVDMDCDSYQDLIVSNGIKRDVRDNDFLKKAKTLLAAAIEEQKTNQVQANGAKIMEVIPSTPLSNYIFRNSGDFTFDDRSEDWGLTDKGWTQGMAYADLDNDGDLDLIMNNMDEPAGLYKNETTGPNHSIIVVPEKDGKVVFNAKVKLHTGDDFQVREIVPTRGYMSSCQPMAHFGLGTISKIDRIEIEWPDGTASQLTDVKPDQTLVVEYNSERRTPINRSTQAQSNAMFAEVSLEAPEHIENEYDDYADEILLPHKMSSLGPCVAAADLDGDGVDEIYVGGSAGYPGKLMSQTSNGRLEEISGPWTRHSASEDTDAIFADVDGDNDLDLLVASGGNENSIGNAAYRDRLYVNNGNGGWSDGSSNLPDFRISTGCIAAADYDSDGDIDLFIGGRQTPKRWPYPTSSYILTNPGSGDFKSVQAYELTDFGMVTEAVWSNTDADPELELVVSGEWMPITIIDNRDEQWTNATAEHGLEESNGWWNCIKAVDIDNDGDMDLIAGNLGTNIKYKASPDEPFKVYSADFDNNGSNDIYLGYYEHGELFPVRGRECSSQQMPFIKEKFPTYNDFAGADVETILGENVEGALILESKSFESSVFINNGQGYFQQEALPMRAQFSTVQDIICEDLNNDNVPDLLIAGNYYDREVETRRSDAGVGLLMLGKGDGSFRVVPPHESGFNAWLDARKIRIVETGSGRTVMVANNNGPLQAFKVNDSPASI